MINSIISKIIPFNVIIPDLINIIGSYIKFTLFDLITYTNINKNLYIFVDENFEKLFDQVEHTKETSMLFFCLKDKRVGSYRKIINYLSGAETSSKKIKYIKKYIKYNQAIPVIKYLLRVNLKCRPVEDKILQKILYLWNTSSKKYCSDFKKFDTAMINNQIILNTYFVVQCQKYRDLAFEGGSDIFNRTQQNIMKALENGADLTAGFYLDGQPVSTRFLIGLCMFINSIIHEKIIDDILRVLSQILCKDYKYTKTSWIERNIVKKIQNNIEFIKYNQTIQKITKLGPREMLVIYNYSS